MMLESESSADIRPQVKVLIVEDAAQVSAVLARVVREEGACPELAAAGQAALDCVSRGAAPDLVLLDLNLPDMTGIEVCRRMRGDPRLRGVPIIMITGQVESEFEGLDAGADDYVMKPFDLRKLRARIAARLRRSGEQADRHPMTRLPGSPAIRREAQRRLEAGEEFFFTYADLYGFKRFNDTAGYHIGDALIQELALLLGGAAAAEEGDFIGHIGGDDFILITRQRPDTMRLESEFALRATCRLRLEGIEASPARLYAGTVHCVSGFFLRFEEIAAAASGAKKAARSTAASS